MRHRTGATTWGWLLALVVVLAAAEAFGQDLPEEMAPEKTAAHCVQQVTWAKDAFRFVNGCTFDVTVHHCVTRDTSLCPKWHEYYRDLDENRQRRGQQWVKPGDEEVVWTGPAGITVDLAACPGRGGFIFVADRYHSHRDFRSNDRGDRYTCDDKVPPHAAPRRWSRVRVRK